MQRINTVKLGDKVHCVGQLKENISVRYVRTLWASQTKKQTTRHGENFGVPQLTYLQQHSYLTSSFLQADYVFHVASELSGNQTLEPYKRLRQLLSFVYVDEVHAHLFCPLIKQTHSTCHVTRCCSCRYKISCLRNCFCSNMCAKTRKGLCLRETPRRRLLLE